MKKVTTSMNFEDIANCIYGIADDNGIDTVDDLYDYLTQNGDREYQVTMWTKAGKPND